MQYPRSPLVSVIIPIYNVEDRIEKCIKSVQNQTLGDIEIIAINDGSTDNTLRILLKLSEADKRVKVFSYTNGGTAFALSMGLQQARGKYIGFSGADDWIEPNMLFKMVQTIREDKTEMVVCNIRKDEGESSKDCLQITKPGIEKENLLERYILFDFDYSVCNKLYKRKLLVKYKIDFEHAHRIGQDLLFNLCVFSRIKSLSLIPNSFYHYVSKDGSLMTLPPKKRILSFNHIIKSFEQFCIENNCIVEWNVFKETIGSGYQKYFFNLILKNPNTFHLSFREYYSYVFSHLKILDPLLLSVPLDGLSHYQRFRKSLLKKGSFRLFSFLGAIRHKTIFRWIHK